MLIDIVGQTAVICALASLPKDFRTWCGDVLTLSAEALSFKSDECLLMTLIVCNCNTKGFFPFADLSRFP